MEIGSFLPIRFAPPLSLVTIRKRTRLVYRFERCWREGELFGFVLRRAARGEPFTYHRLVAQPGS